VKILSNLNCNSIFFIISKKKNNRLIFTIHYSIPIQNSFDLSGKDFHKLSQFENDFNKKFEFKVQGKDFKFTKEEAYLFLPKGYLYILENLTPFTIPLPTNKKYKNIKSEDLIQAFEQLSLLFSILTNVQIDQTNVHVFTYISRILENEYLDSACKYFLNGQAQNQIFVLSSRMLFEHSNKIIKSLYNFTIFINNTKIKCNKAFCCCLSQAVFQASFNDESLSEYGFNNIQNTEIFFSVFEILYGQSFQLNVYSIKEILECCCIVGCTYKFPIFSQILVILFVFFLFLFPTLKPVFTTHVFNG
jgi:hypothetical protein